MSIRLDKCSTFGMQKKNNIYTQILPNLCVADGLIPAVALNGEFLYLGRWFGCDVTNGSVKTALENKLAGLLRVTNSLKTKAQTKLKILSKYIHSQMLFELKLYNFSITWVEHTLDAMCIKYVRDWLEMPVSACVNETLTLPCNSGSLGISSFKHLAEKIILLKRHALRNSSSADVDRYGKSRRLGTRLQMRYW